jgi:glutathione S-transferase
MTRPYLLYGFELSYFTRKMEAALGLYGVPFRRRSKTVVNWRRLERRSGTRKVPVVFGPDGLYRSDTTPMIDQLDALHGERRLFPAGIDGVVVRLVEEWLDEWFPRTVLHYRWQHPDSRAAASSGLAHEAVRWLPRPLRRPLEGRLAGWGDRACRALGLEDPEQQRSVRDEAVAVWGALERQLERTRYALGDRPTAVDAVLIGALRGHYLADPAPRRLLEPLERVRRWADHADRWDGSGDPLPFPERTPFADAVLERMAGSYRRWLLAHAAALERRERSFTVEIDGRSAPFRTLHRPDPVMSRGYLVDRLREELDLDRLVEVAGWLDSLGLGDVFTLIPGQPGAGGRKPAADSSFSGTGACAEREARRE